MEKFKRIAIPVVLLIITGCSTIRAQQKDFQFWPSAGVDVEVIKNLKASVNEEIRLKENCTQMERQINDLGVSYKINKYLKAAVYYRLEANWDNPDHYNWRQGFYSDVMLKYNENRWQFGYRLRLQSSKIEFNNPEDKLTANLVNRHKFSLGYNILKSPLTPFAEEELFIKSENQSMFLSKTRTWFGVAWTPGKNHEFILKYGIDRERMVEDPITAFIISFGYTLNLKI